MCVSLCVKIEKQALLVFLKWPEL